MRRSKSENDVESDEPYLSGAYIRSFVKQLTSSRTKHSSSSMREKESLERERISREQEQEQDPSVKPHKKQVRRRLHTRKPYQEKLLNMAEARREIVTALKLHRAAMKQAAGKQRGPGFQDSGPASNDNSKVYYSPGFCPPYSWSAPSFAPPPDFQENLNFVLPNQTLGLNLNLQDFITAPSSIYSAAASPSTSSSPPPSAAAEETPLVGATTLAAAEVVEQDQIEGIKFIRSMEIRDEDEEFVSSPLDEVMEFPTWLNANESWLQHVNDFCNFQDPALPCLDIEEIEGMDGDWLA